MYSTWSAPAYLHGDPPPPPKKPSPPVIYEVPAWAAPSLPPAYGGCRCICHRQPGVIHVAACCSPARGAHAPVWGDALGAVTGEDGMRLSRAAMYQIAKAYAGSRLSTAEQAEDVSLFQATATNNTGAYLKAAYWMAVAARIVGSRLLAASAQATVSKGNVLLMTPLSGQFTGSVGTIFRDAATTVRGYAGSNPAALAVVSRLEALAAESATLAARAQAAKGTLTPLDDLAVAREKYGRYVLAGGGVVAGLAALWLLSRALARPK